MSVIMYQYKVHPRPVFGRENKTWYAFHWFEPELINSMHPEFLEPIAVWRVKRWATLRKWVRMINDLSKMAKQVNRSSQDALKLLKHKHQ